MTMQQVAPTQPEQNPVVESLEVTGGPLRLRGAISPAQLTANQDNYNPSTLSDAVVLRLSSDASRSITGLAGGSSGRIVIIHNVGSNNLVLVDESASSTAANRFALNGNQTLAAEDIAILLYDSTSSRWRAVRGLPGTPAVEAVISASALKGTTTAGAGDASQLPQSRELATNLVNIDYIAFDQTTEENAFFQYSIPRGWNEGTITFRCKWTAAAGTGTVVFGLKAVALSDDDAIDTAFGTEVTVTDTLIATNDVHISPESAALTIGGTPAEGDIVFFNLARKTADDTLSADAQLLEIVITFTRASYTD